MGTLELTNFLLSITVVCLVGLVLYLRQLNRRLQRIENRGIEEIHMRRVVTQLATMLTASDHISTSLQDVSSKTNERLRQIDSCLQRIEDHQYKSEDALRSQLDVISSDLESVRNSSEAIADK